MRTAAMVVTISGSEVTIATSVVPMKVVPKPVISAIPALLETISGVTTTNAAAGQAEANHPP